MLSSPEFWKCQTKAYQVVPESQMYVRNTVFEINICTHKYVHITHTHIQHIHTIIPAHMHIIVLHTYVAYVHTYVCNTYAHMHIRGRYCKSLGSLCTLMHT